MNRVPLRINPHSDVLLLLLFLHVFLLPRNPHQKTKNIPTEVELRKQNKTHIKKIDVSSFVQHLTRLPLLVSHCFLLVCHLVLWLKGVLVVVIYRLELEVQAVSQGLM